MAKTKAKAAGEKAKPVPNFRTIGVRVSEEYAEWLTRAAKHDRTTIATFLDKAATDRAAAIGFSEPPPDRIS